MLELMTFGCRGQRGRSGWPDKGCEGAQRDTRDLLDDGEPSVGESEIWKVAGEGTFFGGPRLREDRFAWGDGMHAPFPTP